MLETIMIIIKGIFWKGFCGHTTTSNIIRLIVAFSAKVCSEEVSL